jgi:hypothetical protein
MRALVPLGVRRGGKRRAKVNTNGRDWRQLTTEEQFKLALEKFFRYAGAGYFGKCKKWARRLAHSVLTLHPELREEGSLERYFVARLGRNRGYYGAELTAFVDQAYNSGLAKFAIEAGMAAGPTQPNGPAKCVAHLSEVQTSPGTTTVRGPALVPSFHQLRD